MNAVRARFDAKSPLVFLLRTPVVGIVFPVTVIRALHAFAWIGARAILFLAMKRMKLPAARIALLLLTLAPAAFFAEDFPTPATASAPAIPSLQVSEFPIQSDERKALISEYARAHYGIDDWRLTDPEMIVVHFTGTESDAESLSVFSPARLSSSRRDIDSGGAVNVGIHYVIWKDGTIWSLLPETDMARHTIGFNYTALGVEMTGSRPESLTSAQLDSCAALVADITRRLPSIRFLCGHHEYLQSGRAHLSLFRDLVSGYAPTVKVDPGDRFMADLRSALSARYGIDLED
jgi:N-acetyl-anhydromuramyl-L-alanine amidase AmpD